jgi:hypothetical protein
MRWLAVLVVSLAGVALAAAGLFLLRGDDPEELLPDFDQAVPARLRIVEEGDSYRLVFASAVENVGRGPLLIEGERPGLEASAMTVRQLIRRTDGSERARRVPGEIRYVEAEERARWLLLGLESYELRRAADGTLVQASDQVGSCPGDRFASDRAAQAGGEQGDPVWTGDCGEGEPGLLAVRAGISPGYGTRVGRAVDRRFVEVTNVPPGRYVLVHRANPERAIEESDYGNNAASVLVQLRRSGVIPTVRVLARCPDTETCRRD